MSSAIEGSSTTSMSTNNKNDNGTVQKEVVVDRSGGGDGRNGGGEIDSNVMVTDAIPLHLNCKPCDPLKILNFVECLSSTTNSIEMQKIINKYVSVLFLLLLFFNRHLNL